jgi:D-alanine-D-alanine ligase
MNVEKGKRIAVLLGGLSKEREVSLRTGKGMANALRALGYTRVVEIDVGHDVAAVLTREKIEIAMIALHGRYGEDGTIQGLLEYLKIPYCGTGVLGSSLAMDKLSSKRVFEACGVLTPAWFHAGPKTKAKELVQAVETKLGFPVVAKPANEGSTIGLTVVNKASEVEAAQKLALQYDAVIIWEKFIQGTELTVGFLEDRPLPIVEIVPKKGMYDYEAKYTKGMTDYYCPARIDAETARRTQLEALKAYEAVQSDSFGRVDVLWGDGKPWVLEVNTIPGMTETSLLPKAVCAAGGSYEEMVQKILNGVRLKLTDGGES